MNNQGANTTRFRTISPPVLIGMDSAGVIHGLKPRDNVLGELTANHLRELGRTISLGNDTGAIVRQPSIKYAKLGDYVLFYLIGTAIEISRTLACAIRVPAEHSNQVLVFVIGAVRRQSSHQGWWLA